MATSVQDVPSSSVLVLRDAPAKRYSMVGRQGKGEFRERERVAKGTDAPEN